MWDDIYNSLIKEYGYDNKKDAIKSGFISFEFYEIIEDYSSYWEQPDISYLKNDNSILNNIIEIKKENELNKETIKWINEKIYNKKEDDNNYDIS